MGRIYTHSMPDTSIAATANLDVLTLPVGANIPVAIHEITLYQRTLTSWEEKPLQLIRYSGAYTLGSGGTGTLTPQKHNFNDTATAITTARYGDTTAVTSGTATIIRNDSFVLLNGYFYLPAPEDRIIISVSQALVVRLPVALSGTTSFTGSITYEELA